MKKYLAKGMQGMFKAAKNKMGYAANTSTKAEAATEGAPDLAGTTAEESKIDIS